MKATRPNRPSIPWGTSEKSADPETTTTPVENGLARYLVMGAVLAVAAYLLFIVLSGAPPG